ncbi:hypothetical protein I3842_09G202400 [Carya illinoinensis]|uniref:PI31 proteasome regulator N-terminal domain-containing protein n=1 Tax=Carya illinoinensis TaxID=32201 RepID=A0A922E8C9_CARIL|nr:hypothetical protein I3842_09G202400 [Carya illinoinensis]
MVDDKSVMAVVRAARPSFCNNHDKIAFAVGMDQWNGLDDEYTFVYANPDKGSKKVLVKCLEMEDKLLVDALADGDSEPFRLWGWWVFHCSVEDYAGENGGTNYSGQYKNLAELVKKLDTEILSKLDGSSLPSSSNNASRERASRRLNPGSPERKLSNDSTRITRPETATNGSRTFPYYFDTGRLITVNSMEKNFSFPAVVLTSQHRNNYPPHLHFSASESPCHGFTNSCNTIGFFSLFNPFGFNTKHILCEFKLPSVETFFAITGNLSLSPESHSEPTVSNLTLWFGIPKASFP